MGQQEFDLAGTAAALWKIGAGIALIVGLGTLVRGKQSRLLVRTAERRYLRDSSSGRVAIPVRMAAQHATIWLDGCPRAPVVFLQREVAGVWLDQPRSNHYCSGDEKGAKLRVAEGNTATTLLLVSQPGRYHVAVPWGTDWTWSRPFVVE